MHAVNALATAWFGLYIDRPVYFCRKDAECDGSDPSRYEADFRKTISLVRETYATPWDSFDKSFDFGLARYSLGAGYGRLYGADRSQPHALRRTAMTERRMLPTASTLFALTYFPVPGRGLSASKRLHKAMVS